MSEIDNPTQSLFQGADFQLNSSQNNEEDEDLEDQIRRREELQNILHKALDDFNYDDSSIASSTNVSVASMSGVNKDYRDAMPNEQLKVLYEVKVREIEALKLEYNGFKLEKKKEVDELKNRLFVGEAELQQVKESVKNAEALLVEKTEFINEYKKVVKTKESEIFGLKELIEEYKIEVATYKNTINELQLKVAECNPLTMNNRRFESDELHRVHISQINKLEAKLEEQTKKTEHYENESKTLKNDLNKLMQLKNEIEDDLNSRIAKYSQLVESTNKENKELLTVLEKVEQELNHFKERVRQFENNDPILSVESFKRNPADYDSLLVQLEKLKRMLLDKSTEIETLTAKTAFYETDFIELIEYRNLKSHVLNMPVNECGDINHMQQLLIMQGELKHLNRLISEKDSQIVDFRAINSKLQQRQLEQVEQLLTTTRDNLDSMAQKYDYPRLGEMTEELCAALKKVTDLEKNISELKLEKAGLESMISKYKNDLNVKDKTITDAKSEIESLKVQLISSQESFNNQMSQLLANLKENSGSDIDNPKVVLIVKTEVEELIRMIKEGNVEKFTIEEKLLGWNKQLDFVKFSKKQNLTNSVSDEKEYKELYSVTLKKLTDTQTEINRLKEQIQELNSGKTLSEGELCNIQFELQNCKAEIERLTQERDKLIKENEKQDSYHAKAQNACKVLDESLTKTKDEVHKLRKELTEERLKNLASDQVDISKLRNELKQREQQIEVFVRDKENYASIFECFQQQLIESNAKINKLQYELAVKKGLPNENIIEKLKAELADRDEQINLFKEESKKIAKVIRTLKIEVDRLTKELELKDKVRRSLKNEMLEADDKNDTTKPDHSVIQAEVLKRELELQDQYQKELAKTVSSIENKYTETVKVYQEENERYKAQELNVRKQIGQLLAECAQKMRDLEIVNAELKEKLSDLELENVELKKKTAHNFQVNNMELKRVVDQREQECRQVVEEAVNQVRKSNAKFQERTNEFLRALETINGSSQKICKTFNKTDKEVEKLMKKAEMRKLKLVKTLNEPDFY